MGNGSVFSKTAKGIAELGDRDLGLPRDHYRLLGVVDGRSNVSELSEKTGVSEAQAEAALNKLVSEGLVNRISGGTDQELPVAPNGSAIFVAELSPEEGVRAWAEAQRGARALHDQGFFAHTVRPLEGGIPPKILSVEDDPLLANLLTVLLQREGFLVRSAADGATAYRFLEEETPDLVILDVMLPDASGFQLLEWIRKHPQLTNLPAIMLTALVGEEDVMRGLRAGADGYIFKPFKPEPLLQCIRSVLKL